MQGLSVNAKIKKPQPQAANADTVRAMDSNITIKEGVTIRHPVKFFPEHANKDLDGNSYALLTEGKSKTIIDGGVFYGHVKLSGYQDTNGSVQINGGTSVRMCRCCIQQRRIILILLLQ